MSNKIGYKRARGINNRWSCEDNPQGQSAYRSQMLKCYHDSYINLPNASNAKCHSNHYSPEHLSAAKNSSACDSISPFSTLPSTFSASATFLLLSPALIAGTAALHES